MTPEQAMHSKFANDMPEGNRATLKLLLDACVATAEKNETRRCAVRARSYTTLQWGNTIADDLLHTGGLEVEE